MRMRSGNPDVVRTGLLRDLRPLLSFSQTSTKQTAASPQTCNKLQIVTDTGCHMLGSILSVEGLRLSFIPLK